MLSGNRNFEGRINPDVKMNYLASPPLVVAYALAGTMDLDLATEPLGHDTDGNPVTLEDIWPSPQEIQETISSALSPEQFTEGYADVFAGDERWTSLDTPEGETFTWDPDSTYVRKPPYFEGMDREPSDVTDLDGARVLLKLGDSVTTDHISPAGAIKEDSPAGRYLKENGIERKDFNSYGSRRGNHEVMIRGTFANIRLRNELRDGDGKELPAGRLDRRLHPRRRADGGVRRGAELRRRGHPAGRARGQGVRLGLVARLGGQGHDAARRARGDRRVLRAHPPLQPRRDGRPAAAVPGRSGRRLAGAHGHRDVRDLGRHGAQRRRGARHRARHRDPRVGGDAIEFDARLRIDTPGEAAYYRNGGILPYVLRKMLG